MLDLVVSLAMPFASIAGLVYNYYDLKTGASKQDLDSLEVNIENFMEYLSDRNLKEISVLIESNAKLSMAIQELFSKEHNQIMNQLNDFSQLMMNISAKIPAFEDIAKAIDPQSGLSDQAIYILRAAQECHSFSLLPYGGSYGIMESNASSQYNLDQERIEQKYLEEDLDTLIKFGLLRKSNGNYSTTRISVDFLKTLP